MPADFARIAAGRSETTRDVPCIAWGLDGSSPDHSVRLQRLDGPQIFEFTVAAERLAHDEAGNPIEPTRRDLYQFGVRLLAESIVDGEGRRVFDDPAKVHWLSSQISAISELLDPALQLNGIGSAALDQQKKSSDSPPS